MTFKKNTNPQGVALAIALVVLIAVGVYFALAGSGGIGQSANAPLPTLKKSAPTLLSGSPYKEQYYWRTWIKVTNDYEPRGLASVGVGCVFYNGDAPVGKSATLVSSVQFGATVDDQIIGPPEERIVNRVVCKVNYANPI